MKYYSSEKIASLFSQQQANAPSVNLSPAKTRITKLDLILDYINDPNHQEKLIQSIQSDMKRPEVEVFGGEIATIQLAIKNLKENLTHWLKPKKVKTPISLAGASSYIQYESKGCSLIISPWNYPFQLAVMPLIYSIGAGNTAILKPSEYSHHTSAFLDEMCKELFDPKEIVVVQGEIEEATTLLSLPFDHIYFTGSPAVGKIVMKAAAKNLSSLTLELGGKSPCIVDETADLKDAAKKIAWGKCFNAGQTCIAPDYVMVHKEKAEYFIQALKTVYVHRFGQNEEALKSSRDLGRIISDRHFERGVEMLADAVKKGGSIAYGGYTDQQQRFISPTILTNTNGEMRIMQEEIFNPLLPVITYQNEGDLINQFRKLPKPLAFYIFSSKQKNIERFLNISTAGGTVINDVLIHYANENLPFGGVNNSGIGKSHGTYGLYAFMNERAVMQQKLSATKLLHPPYNSRSLKIIKSLAKLS